MTRTKNKARRPHGKPDMATTTKKTFIKREPRSDDENETNLWRLSKVERKRKRASSPADSDVEIEKRQKGKIKSEPKGSDESSEPKTKRGKNSKKSIIKIEPNSDGDGDGDDPLTALEKTLQESAEGHLIKKEDCGKREHNVTNDGEGPSSSKKIKREPFIKREPYSSPEWRQESSKKSVRFGDDDVIVLSSDDESSSHAGSLEPDEGFGATLSRGLEDSASALLAKKQTKGKGRAVEQDEEDDDIPPVDTPVTAARKELRAAAYGSLLGPVPQEAPKKTKAQHKAERKAAAQAKAQQNGAPTNNPKTKKQLKAERKAERKAAAAARAREKAQKTSTSTSTSLSNKQKRELNLTPEQRELRDEKRMYQKKPFTTWPKRMQQNHINKTAQSHALRNCNRAGEDMTIESLKLALKAVEERKAEREQNERQKEQTSMTSQESKDQNKDGDGWSQMANWNMEVIHLGD